MKSVLFVCTGNVFRSLVAEYALKSQIGSVPGYVVSSAGIEAEPQEVHWWVAERLRELGADVSGHRQRKLSAELAAGADLLIAMSRDHRRFIRQTFGREAWLFNQVCVGIDEPVLDLHEALPGWQEDPDRARAYVLSVIEHIWSLAPGLVAKLRDLRSS